MQNITKEKPLEVELFVWMKEIKDSSTGTIYLEIGEIKSMPNTLLVTRKGGNGGGVMFCTKHHRSYQIKGSCDECRNSYVEPQTNASATTCSASKL